MPNIGGLEIAIIVIVLVLLFGAKKLPDMARGLGRSLRVFKSEINEMQNDGKPSAEPSAPTPELPPAPQSPPEATVVEADGKRSA